MWGPITVASAPPLARGLTPKAGGLGGGIHIPMLGRGHFRGLKDHVLEPTGGSSCTALQVQDSVMCFADHDQTDAQECETLHHSESQWTLQMHHKKESDAQLS